MSYPSRILLIEAEPSLRHTLAMILQQAGYAVTTAGHDQEDTPCSADAQAYDLIFLDIDQVESSAADLLQTIYRLSPDIPTLILAASAANGRMNVASPLERRAYLVKPIGPADMLARIRDLLERSLPPGS